MEGEIGSRARCYVVLLNLHVMVVLPPDRIYVQGDPCGESEGFEQVVDHLGGDCVVGARCRCRKVQVSYGMRWVSDGGKCGGEEEGGQCQDASSRRVKEGEKRGLGSRSPIFSRVKGRSETKYGREEISMTALDNAYMSIEGINKRTNSLESALCTWVKTTLPMTMRLISMLDLDLDLVSSVGGLTSSNGA
jgi:hypothetical protein